LRLDHFDYELPEELIAQEPLVDREASRMLVLERKTGRVSHRSFSHFCDYLLPGDALVLNDTRVIPARLIGHKLGGGALVEVLLLHRRSATRWEALVRPGRRLHAGAEILFGDGEMRCRVDQVLPEGVRELEFSYDGLFENVLDRLGETPLPPYIRKKLADPERYQTVYARERGSAAAPTAGMHFTDRLLSRIAGMGVETVYLTLHVGLGTFRPVKVDNIKEHRMHSEFYSVGEDAASALNRVRSQSGRIVAVGTTSCRVLETVSDKSGLISAGSGWTDIFIYPGYEFKAVDILLTNFHLPRSTLVMLVSAFAGTENTLAAYGEAVRQSYRFFSFGDAMLII
jgi:S-adenosylmethionine:tRNA ribosyltransferase-isomerase